MFKQFFILEWKSFFRAANFKVNLAIKILQFFGVLYFMVVLGFMGALSYKIIEEMGFNPFETTNRFLIYYFLFDLAFRFFLQKTPVMNIRPLLTQNVSKNKVVVYALSKSIFSFFNILHLFYFLPFSAVLIYKGFSPSLVIMWCSAMLLMVVFNNFLNILVDKKDWVFYLVLGLATVFGSFHYYNFFNITDYTGWFFAGLFQNPLLFLLVLFAVVFIIYITFNFFRSNLYLDASLKIKQEVAKTENFDWLNSYGYFGTFLKNDIRLLKRNKRSKTALLMSGLFLFYGLLFSTGSIEAYDNEFFKIFGSLFVSGGFIFCFGQFVPSWDSSYYPLMMSQNIPYKEYLSAKWWLMVIGTIIATILATFYLFFGLDTYLAIVAVAVYNIGINAYITMLAGAFTRTPIDLASSSNAFGDKKAFNIKTLLLVIPQLILPVVLYFIGYFIFNKAYMGYAFIILAGIIGFLLKNNAFNYIEKIYKQNKYETIAAYKQKN